MTRKPASREGARGKSRSRKSVRESSWTRNVREFFSALLVGRRVSSLQFKNGKPDVLILSFDDGGSVLVDPLLDWDGKYHGMSLMAWPPSPNDKSSATRRTGRGDCNRDAPAGFAAAHG